MRFIIAHSIQISYYGGVATDLVLLLQFLMPTKYSKQFQKPEFAHLLHNLMLLLKNIYLPAHRRIVLHAYLLHSE